MKIALLIDGSTVTRWQAEAIEQLDGKFEFQIYNCTNARPGRRRLRHLPYYALNLVSLRSPRTRRVQLPTVTAAAPRVDFECDTQGEWQSLPQTLIERIREDQPALIVKFGMGLLKLPEGLPIPILSYHHGDPRGFRGRPAGFYEMLHGERVIGQIVQILSNRLDAGQVLAFAETKIHRQSYRATMSEAYAVSPLLLPQAVRAALQEQSLDISPTGKLYRLPSPLTVVRFALQRLGAKARRLAYGAFIEKAWQVAEAPRVGNPADLLGSFPAPASWLKVRNMPAYRFLADPFYHPHGDGMLVEALRSSTGRGEILHISEGGCRRLLSGPGHFSYPATISDSGKTLLLPEVCEWSEPRLYRLDAEGACDPASLKLATSCRLVDPTPIKHNGTVYLLANVASEPGSVLRLWHAPNLSDVFEEHSASPILISPAGARMGGLVWQEEGRLYRIGQDGRNDYGDGLILFQIEALSPGEYRERPIGALRFNGVRGPHTMNFGPDRVLFDFYRNRFALLAGFRRIQGRLAKRSG